MSTGVSCLDAVMKAQRNVRVTHSIVHVDSIDLVARSLVLRCEYHVHVSNTAPAASPSEAGPAGGKALGLSFVLPDGTVSVETVSINGRPVPALSPMEDLQNHSNFNLSYWAFPEAANTEALASIFARMCEKRRDLISYEEVSKAHRAASTGQSFGLLVKIPPIAVLPSESSVSVNVNLTVKDSPVFRSFLASGHATTHFATLGQEQWFPVPARLMLLPSGVAVTAQPMEHQRHKITVHLPSDLRSQVVCTGDRLPGLPHLTFESSWVNPRAVGLFVGSFAQVEEKGVFTAIALPSFASDLRSTLRGGIITEISQVLAPWFASPAQLLPPVNLVFVPLPAQRDFFIHGNTIVMDASVLHGEGMPDRKSAARCLLAEAVAALWIARVMPAFADVWIPVGLAAMLADRFVEFHLGSNEYQLRVSTRKQRFHAMVERGLDWRPLSLATDVYDPLVRVKSPLVIDCLRRALVGEADLRSALHELATVASGKKGPWATDAFFYLLTCTVGQHTEAGAALPWFKEEWVRSVGAPVIHVGFSMLDKKRFIVNVSQRPLQRVSCHDNLPLSSPPTPNKNGGQSLCACGQDFVGRTGEADGGASYGRPHLGWPATARRRFWPGELEVSIYRASCHFVPIPVTMEETTDVATQVLTVPYVTPRKHELVLNRSARDDELVHGWMTVIDDRWMLAKIVVCQSPLMWCNELQLSRNVTMEHFAVEALQHIRGSTLVHEVLSEALTQEHVFWRVRVEAGRALLHLAIGCGERDAVASVVRWLDSFNRPTHVWSEMEPRVFLAWSGIMDNVSHAKRSADRRDAKNISDCLLATVRAVERSLALTPNSAEWRVNPHLVLSCAVRNAVLSTGSELKANNPACKAIDVWLRSDLYGPPLASPERIITEAVVSASNGSWPFVSDPKFLESLTLDPSRRIARSAIRAYLASVGGSDTEAAWTVRLAWVDRLTDEILTATVGPLKSVQSLAWLVDAWDTLIERYRRESSKSGLHVAVNSGCERLWRYLTAKVPRLPPSARGHIQQVVHSIYIQAFGTGVPVVLKTQTGMDFWMPYKEHERIYKRFMLRGATVRPEAPKAPAPKKPRILITGAGSVPLDQPFSRPAS